MKKKIRVAMACVAAGLAGGVPGRAPAQEMVQSFVLQPGWNSIFLEVQPTNTAPDAVFTNAEIRSVWTWSARVAATTFIQDPTETGWNTSEWLVHFPRGGTNAFLSTLYGIYAQRAYLVKIEAATNIALDVTGRPEMQTPEWAPDAYNLRGFPVDDDVGPVSFQTFFRPSPAHCDRASGQLERIYELNAAGQWVLANASNDMSRGIAYWVYCRGASTYAAPLFATTSTGDGMDFMDSSQSKEMTFQNLTTNAAVCRIKNAEPAIPLAYRSLASLQTVDGWFDFGTMQELALAPEQTIPLQLMLKPDEMVGARLQNVMVVRDAATTLWYVPVSAERAAE